MQRTYFKLDHKSNRWIPDATHYQHHNDRWTYYDEKVEKLLSEAMDDFNIVLKLTPNVINDSVIDFSQIELGHSFTEAIKVNPVLAEAAKKLAMAFYKCGHSYADKGNSDKAIHDFEQAIKLIPDFAKTVDQDLAYTYMIRGLSNEKKGHFVEAMNDFDCAIKHAERAYKRNMHSAACIEKLAMAYYCCSRVCLSNNNRDKAINANEQAIKYFEEAIKLKPDSELTIEYLSRAYSLLGERNFKKNECDTGVNNSRKNERQNSDYSSDYAVLSANELAASYIDSGYHHFENCQFAQGLNDFCNALVVDPGSELGILGLKEFLVNIEEGTLCGKRNIFDAIKLLPIADQKHLLKQCLDPDTCLGKFFLKWELASDRSLENEILKEMKEYLEHISPSANAVWLLQVGPQYFNRQRPLDDIFWFVTAFVLGKSISDAKGVFFKLHTNHVDKLNVYNSSFFKQIPVKRYIERKNAYLTSKDEEHIRSAGLNKSL